MDASPDGKESQRPAGNRRVVRYRAGLGQPFVLASMVFSAMVSIVVYGAVLAITGVFTYPALIATRLLGAPIVTAIAFEVQRQAAMRAGGPMRFLSWPGMWAQRLTTAPPDPHELEVACAALAVALEEPDPAAAEEAAEEQPQTARDATPVADPQPSA